MFEDVQARDETELENLVIEHVESVEAGLTYLDHQRKTETGRLDVLCVDADGVFVVMELKAKEEDAMLMQGLEYLDYVNENRDRYASFYARKLKSEGKNVEIDPTSPPRLILVAPSFTDMLKKCVKYVDENYPVSLKHFKILKLKRTGEIAPIFIDLTVEAPQIFEEPMTLEDHLNRISETGLRDLCEQAIERIRAVGPGVEVQSRGHWLAFFNKGRRFAVIQARKSMFHVRVVTGADWKEFPKITVKNEGDFGESFLEKIRERYKEVGKLYGENS